MVKNRKYGVAGKAAAVILCFLTALIAAGSAAGITYMAANDFYVSTEREAQNTYFESYLGNTLFTVMRDYADDGKIELSAYTDGRNLMLSITDAFTGEVVASDYDGGDTLSSISGALVYKGGTYYFYNIYQNSASYDYTAGADAAYKVTAYIPAEFAENDTISVRSQLVTIAYSWRYGVLAAALLALIANVVLFIYLMCVAGRGKDGEVLLSPIDKIPFDLYLCIYAALAFIFCCVFNYVSVEPALAAVLVSAAYLLVIAFAMSFAARCKSGNPFRGMFIVRFTVWLFRGLLSFVRRIPLIWKSLLFLICFSIWMILSTISIGCGSRVGPVMLISGLAAFFIIGVITALDMQTLKKSGEKLAAGDLDSKTDTKRLYGDFKKHGENLNSVGEGMSKAIDARMKSEHMKTELITNVSHDLKTPLTSIVSYIDLLEKEDVQNDKAKEYIEVLDRQSARLKKLTEDLVEASKASTGNLEVNRTRCELGEMIAQTAGEYEERLADCGLELVVTKPDAPVVIMADGKHLWRVFDNLMNNVCKYAQRGTRVYITLEADTASARVVFRNISNYQLNIPADELTARFVRGDQSRHTEGSGLGLSIAESLVKLQDGIMTVSVDGDLFKVTLSFPKAEETGNGDAGNGNTGNAALL